MKHKVLSFIFENYLLITFNNFIENINFLNQYVHHSNYQQSMYLISRPNGENNPQKSADHPFDWLKNQLLVLVLSVDLKRLYPFAAVLAYFQGTVVCEYQKDYYYNMNYAIINQLKKFFTYFFSRILRLIFRL